LTIDEENTLPSALFVNLPSFEQELLSDAIFVGAPEYLSHMIILIFAC